MVACGDDKVAPDSGSPDTGVVDTGTGDTGPKMDGGSEDGGAADGGDTGTEDTGVNAFPLHDCSERDGPCVQVRADDVNGLLDAANELEAGATLVLGTGTFAMDNALVLRGAAGITLLGQGREETVLDFSGTAAQTNGVDVVGDDFSIADLTITDAPKDGLRVEDSARVKIQRIKVTWAGGPSSSNGSYGIYPVRSSDVLIEDCEAYNSSDAGIYVGQTVRAIVRRNIAMQNVAGIEIENTQFADVYENTVEDNTGGLLIFDLPGNPVVGRDIKIHHNVIRANNRANFAPTDGVDEVTTVSQIPAGTGTFALASRRLEIADNTYENNQTGHIAILSGLVIQDDPAGWATPFDDLVGRIAGLDLENAGDAVLNFRTHEVYVHGNSFVGGGDMPDIASPTTRPLGAILGALYPADGQVPVDAILYDGVGEAVVAGTSASNQNRICVGENLGATFGVLDLPTVQTKLILALMGQGPPPTLEDTFRPASPFGDFGCEGFVAGPIPEIRLDFLEGDGDFALHSCEDIAGDCHQFEAGQESMVLDQVNELEDDTTIILGAGTFAFDNAVILRGADGITLLGQGMDRTVLDFGQGASTQFNGVDVVGDRFRIEDMTLLDAPKDALRVEDSDDIVIRRLRTTWTEEGASTNGSYGIYPVRSTNVLIELCEATNSADAGIYVGQTRGAIVRNNYAAKNVAGLEIENTQFADVYGNEVTDNTGGLVVFDLPGNPVVGRDIWLHHNTVVRNNRENFAPTLGVNEVTTVSQIPAGTGTFALASRRVHISQNLFLENQSVAVALLSGLAIQDNPQAWAIPLDDVVGDISDLELETIPDTAVLNFRSSQILVSDNRFHGNGASPDAGSPLTRPLGAILALTYDVSGNGLAVDDITYDGIEQVVDPMVPANNTNEHHICLAGNGGASYATLNLPVISTKAQRAFIGQGPPPTPDDLYRPAAPFAPFDCSALDAGPVSAVELPIALD